MQDLTRKQPMSRRGRSPSSGEAMRLKKKSPNIYDFDGLLSTDEQVAIRTSLTLPALPSTDNNYLASEWFGLAACKGQTLKFFRHSCSKRCGHHPNGCSRIKNVRECRAICAGCPVLEHCRIWSLNTELPYGLAAALTESERDQLQETYPSREG